jgi:hypothetical protein
VTTTVSYRDAAIALWGPGGAYAHDAYAQFQETLFPDLPEQLPIVIGLTAYGHCMGLTAGRWEHGPRINLASELFNGSNDRADGKPGRIHGGTGWIDDTLVHEMIHAHLILEGLDWEHDSESWYDAVRRLSPAVLGHELDIRRGADRKSVRVPNPLYRPGNDHPKTLVRKVKGDGVPHKKVAMWPQAFRAEDHDWGPRIPVPAY